MTPALRVKYLILLVVINSSRVYSLIIMKEEVGVG